jgi:protein TonB
LTQPRVAAQRFGKDTMYSGHLSGRDRAGPVGAVVVVHLALAAMLLALSGNLPPQTTQPRLKAFDVRDLPPPPMKQPLPPPPSHKRPAKEAKSEEAAPAAPKSQPTPVVAPPPKLEVPVINPVVAAPVLAVGNAPTVGAANAGTGTGAGGVGRGFGGGGEDAGNGEGYDGTGTYPLPRFRHLSARNFPRDLVNTVPLGSRTFIILTVQTNGQATNCTIRESSGNPALDGMVCQMAEQRFRYVPARRADGTPYVAKAAYMQPF